MAVVQQVQQQLEGLRIKLDLRTEVTPGFKFNDWELRGVPLRIEIGPKDVDNGVVTVSRRYMPGKAGKSTLGIENLKPQIDALLVEIQAAMLDKATRFRDDNIHHPQNYLELQQVVQNGWAYSWWCGRSDCETKVKDETKATTRCIPLDQPDGGGVVSFVANLRPIRCTSLGLINCQPCRLYN